MKTNTEKKLQESMTSLKETMMKLQPTQLNDGVGEWLGNVGSNIANTWATKHPDFTNAVSNAAGAVASGVKNFAGDVSKGYNSAQTAAGTAAKPQANPAAAKPRQAPDPEVLKIQQELIKRGAKIKADGIMGPATQAAQQQFATGGAQDRATEMDAYLKMSPEQQHTYNLAASKPTATTAVWDQAAAQAAQTKSTGSQFDLKEDTSFSGSMKKYMNMVEASFFGHQLPDENSMDITGTARANQRKPGQAKPFSAADIPTVDPSAPKPFSAADIPTEPPMPSATAAKPASISKADPEVMQLQKDLINKGYKLKADGIMGPDTQRVLDYEKEFGSDYAASQNAELQKLKQPMSEHVSFGYDQDLTRIINLSRG